MSLLDKMPSKEMTLIIPPSLQNRYERWLRGYPKPLCPEDPKTMQDLYEEEFMFREYTNELETEDLKDQNFPEPFSKQMIQRMKLSDGGRQWINPFYFRRVLTWDDRSRVVKEKPPKRKLPRPPQSPCSTTSFSEEIEEKETHTFDIDTETKASRRIGITKCPSSLLYCLAIICILAILYSIVVITMQAFMTHTPIQVNETLRERTKRSIYIYSRSNYKRIACCTKGENKLSQSMLNKIVGWHEQKKEGVCKIDAIIVIIRASPKNTSMCLSPNPIDKATRRKIQELKRQRTQKKGLLSKTTFKEKVIDTPSLPNEKVEPLNWPDPSKVPHHFLLMHEFGKQQSEGKGDCWVCSHMHSGEHIYPMLAKPMHLPSLINLTDLETVQITTTNKPFLIQGYSEPPNFCFLNGHYSRDVKYFANARFCADTDVNFTLLDIESYITNQTVDIKGLNTVAIADADERIERMFQYNLTECPSYKPQVNQGPLTSWLKRVNKTDIRYGSTDPINIVQWMCLMGLRSGQNTFSDVPAPRLPKGWVVVLWIMVPYYNPFS
ncbi:uncharacterized protein LOC122939401 [Bufo gargarizans]|uniref:uncharacterized protein LOC122939401 n=1 Tax=Bufo gargarizans TaxID=30331 RepID=UPI001CF5AB13|nr:uncharacterized protein LOC122939401 [Bufo gargarizans]